MKRFQRRITHPYFHALLFPIPCPAALGEVVDGGKLNQGREDKGVTHGHEPVHGRGVGHFGQRVPGADAERGHGQHGGHPWVQTKAVATLNCVSFTSRNALSLQNTLITAAILPGVNVHDGNITQINKTEQAHKK